MRISAGRTGLKAWLAASSLAVATLVSLTHSAPPTATAQQPPSCTIAGSAARDILRGTAAADRLCGRGGNDIVLARAGNDSLDGGAGNDILLGGPGNDTLLGGPGDDLLVDNSGADTLDGGPGRDRCIGRASTTFRNCEVVVPPPRPPAPVPPAAPAPQPKASPAPPAPAPAPAPGQPAFDPAQSSVVVRGDEVVVTFQEAGLAAGAVVDIEVTATRTTTVTCVDPRDGDRVVLRTSSTATAGETATYEADANGRVSGSRTLSAAPGKVEITGYVCRTTDEVVVTLRDLTSGATLTLSP